MSEAIRLSAIEVSPKDLMVLRSLIKLMGHELEQSWALQSGPGGDVSLVDVDNEAGSAIWETHARNGEPVIALSRQRAFPADHVLHKPLRSREIVRVLNGLSSSTTDDGEGRGWTSMMLGLTENQLPLAEHLRRHTWKSPVMLNGVQKPAVLIDPGSGAWYCSGDMQRLVPLFQAQLMPDAALPLSSAEFVERCTNLTQRPLSELQWQAGLSQSRGAVHPDLAADARMMLTHVPRQARGHQLYESVAKALTRGPKTLDDLQAESGQAPENIAAFVNACYACGYLLVSRAPGRAGI